MLFSVEIDLAGCNALQRFYEEGVFYTGDPGRQCFGVIAFKHRHTALNQNGPGIIFAVDQMDCRPAFPVAGIQNRLMDAGAIETLSAIARQECRVNIEDPVVKGLEGLGPDLSHVSTKHDEIDVVRSKGFADRVIKFIVTGVGLRAHVKTGNPEIFRPLEGKRCLVIGDDQNGFAIQPAITARLCDRLHGTAAMGGQKSEAKGFPGKSR